LSAIASNQPDRKTESRFFYLGLIPVVLFIALVVIFRVWQPSASVFEPPHLLAILNAVFLALMPFIVAYLAGRSYLATGSLNILLIGCALLVFGAGNLVAGWAIEHPGPNSTVTIHNIASLVASVFYVMAAFFLAEGTAGSVGGRRAPNLFSAYLAILLFVVLLSIATIAGVMPPFFVVGRGPTPLREIVLTVAVIFHVLSAIFALRLYWKRRISFLYWYCLALLLIGVGLAAVLMQPAVGSPIGWVGRISQYVGCIYFLAAVIVTVREARSSGTSVAKTLASYFRESEIHYRRLVETAQDPIILTDSRGQVLLWSPAAEKLFGFARREAVGSDLTDLVGLDRSLLGPFDETAPAGGNANAIETTLKRKDGSILFSEISAWATEVTDERTITFVIRDITERRRAEQALQESESILRSFFDAPGDMRGIVEVVGDDDVRHIADNAVTAAFIGVAPDAMKNKLGSELGEPREILRTWIGLYNESMKRGRPVTLEYHDVRGDQAAWLSATVSYLGTPPHGDPRFTYVVRDVTERKRAEIALQQTEQRWATTLSSIGDAVIATDVTGRITFMNSVAEGLTGWTLPKASTKPLTEVFNIVNEQTRSVVESPVTRVLREGMVVGLANHTILVRKDGIETPIDDSGAPIKDEDGNTTGVVLVFHDITDRRKTEEQLEQSTQKVKDILNSIQDDFYVLDRGWKFVYASKSFTSRIGKEPKDFVGNNIWEMFPNHIGTDLEENFLAAMDRREIRRFEVGGRYTDAYYTMTAFPSPEGITVLGTDITDRKRAEEALRISEEHYRSLFDNMLNGYAYCRMLFDESVPKDFTYVSVNAAFETLTGLKNVTGKNVSEVIPGIRQSDPELFETYGRVALTGMPERFEAYVEALKMWFSISVYSPRKEYFVAVFDVITERKRAEAEAQRLFTAVQEEKDRLSVLINSIQDEVWFADTDRRFTLANPSALREFGLDTDNGIDIQKFAESLEVYRPDGTPRPVDEAPPLHALQGEMVRNQEEMIRTPGSGELRYREVSAAPVRDVGGSIIGSVSIVRDITKRRRAEEALRKAHDELELRVQERTAELQQAYDRLKEETEEREQIETQLRQAQKMEALGTMSGGIAHDFNNILAAIIGFSELLEGHVAKGSRDAHHLDRIMEAGIRGRELVRQMLAFARKAEQEKKPLALRGIVEESTKLLRATTPATINIRVNALNEALILGDSTQIQQVLMNLCTNATFAMREKGGSLDIELSDHNVSPSNGDPHGIEPGQYVKLIVRDTGIGISADIMDKIFDPFFTTKKLGEGTGLGLSVVHGIVKQHDGYITVDSEPGRGSTFSVYFPRITGGPEENAIRDDEIPTGSERILFVDDEEALVEMGEDILAELGYEVTSRMNGREALALLKADPSRFDLVITDQTMPEMTGIDLAGEILALRADMPIIMCTGFSYVVDADKARTAGIKAFAMKPLTKREIAKTIRKVIDE
jgi:PAS domain S-box-containing protein